MGMEPEHKKRERAVALGKAVETAAANDVSAGVRRGCARSRIGTGTLYGAPSW